MKNLMPFILLMLMLPLSSVASEGAIPPIVHKAVIEAVEPDASLKLLFSGINDLVPTADMSHDAPSGTLIIVSPVQLMWGELEVVVNASGFALISLELE